MLLADTSAWIWSRRRSYPELREWFDEELRAGNIATCDLVKLELLYGSRSGEKHDARLRELDALRLCPIGPAEWRRAIQVQNRLAHVGAGHHKVAKLQDLLVAAAGESVGLELIHYDEDFEWIREVTEQPMRWLAPRGSLR